MKRRLRQELYYSRKFGIREHFVKLNEPISQGLNRLDGMVTYISFIEKATACDSKQRWHALLARDDLTPKVHPRHDRPPIQRLTIETLIQQVRDDYTADPFSAGDRTAIRKQGLHYAAAHPDLRTAFIHRLATLPFRCYVTVKRGLSTPQAVSEQLARIIGG